jgi:uncharacterized membrane protein YjgN (DUF898 family)
MNNTGQVLPENTPLHGPFATEGLPPEQKTFEGATQHTLQFKGTGKEYFKIWIVNLVLSLLTLGIYSAWATVRTKKYFYGNTFLDESSFDYHATPKQILIGRLIAIGIFILVSLLSNLSPLLSIFIFLALFILIPVIIQRSIRFNHSVTSFRNIRFSFKGSAGNAYTPYFWWPIASGFTGNLLYPFVHHAANDYMVNNSRYGQLKFRAQLDSGHYFLSYLKMIGLIIGAIIIVVLLGAAFAAVGNLLIDSLSSATSRLPQEIIGVLIALPVALVYLSIVLLGKSFIEAVIRQHYFSRTYLAGIANFDSSLNVVALFWILLKNTVLLVLTLGLYYPWAKVNLTQYRVEHTHVHLSDDVGDVISEQQQFSSFGDELGDAFNVDVIGGL